MADVRIAGKEHTSAASYTDTRCLAPADPLPPRTALRLVMGRVRAEIQRWPISWPERNRLLSGIEAAVHRALSDGGPIPRGRAAAIAGEVIRRLRGGVGISRSLRRSCSFAGHAVAEAIQRAAREAEVLEIEAGEPVDALGGADGPSSMARFALRRRGSVSSPCGPGAWRRDAGRCSGSFSRQGSVVKARGARTRGELAAVVRGLVRRLQEAEGISGSLKSGRYGRWAVREALSEARVKPIPRFAWETRGWPCSTGDPPRSSKSSPWRSRRR